MKVHVGFGPGLKKGDRSREVTAVREATYAANKSSGRVEDGNIGGRFIDSG